MDLRYTPEEIAFRDEMRHFFRTEIPAEIRAKGASGRHGSPDDMRTCQRIMNQHGLAVPNWPVEWGGKTWTPMQRYIFTEEVLAHDVPAPLPFNTAMVGPVIAQFGTQAQKERFLPATANMDIWWCQGFSEPGAGSDLASLTTRAVRDGDHYVINGQKTWTTLAQYADWIFLLARTNPEARKPQEGISFIVADMKTPGITVRPIQLVDGGHEVNEVFFDDVRVPTENLVGTEHRGWDCAKFLLANERSNIARVGTSKARLRRLRELAQAVPVGDGTMWESEAFRHKVFAVETELKALEMTQLRVIAAEQNNGGRPNPASSILKIKGSEIQQRTTELALELAGPFALPFHGEDEEPEEGANDLPDGFGWADTAAPTYFNYRKVTIYGGSNEIQRNIIAKMVLGF
jgi:alkylation response protein AidB-like acyl-CoA dehydrogenase